MPITILQGHEGELIIDNDVTDMLKVTKYEPEEISFYKGAKLRIGIGAFPYFIPKTDETRVQVLQERLDKVKDMEFVITEKLDGTSFTAFIKNGEFGICSRNMLVSPTIPSPYSDAALAFDLENKFKDLKRFHIPYNFALQGELIGAGIQGNKYGLKDYSIRWFNFFNIDIQKDIGFYLSDADEFKEFQGHTLGTVTAMLDMETVPILNSSFKMTNDIDTLINMAIGKSMIADTEREGLVFRSKYNNQFNNYNRRLSFKAINPDFLCPLLP